MMSWAAWAMARQDEESLRRIKEHQEERKVGYAQWTEHDDGAGYTASGRTVQKLPPGFYDLEVVREQVVWLPVRARTDMLLKFPDSVTDEVVSEIETFWSKEKSFVEHGLPFKRGVLLWGPAGSGKTSLIQLLARDVVERNGIVLLFGNCDLFIAAYRQLRDVEPKTPLVVIMEDIDAIIEKQNETKVLNVLDGVEDVHRVVFIASTNYPERLGARIVNRPSRFDRRFKVPHPAAASRKLYLNTLCRQGDDVDVARMVKDSEGMSLAHLKELFVATVILDSDYAQTVKILKGMGDKAHSANDEQDFLPNGQYA